MNHFILKHKQLSEIEAFVTVPDDDGIILTCTDMTEEGFLGVKGIVGHSISDVYEEFHVKDSEISFDSMGCRFHADGYYLDRITGVTNHCNVLVSFLEKLNRHCTIDFVAHTDYYEEYCNPAVIDDDEQIIFIRVTGGNNHDNPTYMQVKQVEQCLHVLYTDKNGNPISGSFGWDVECNVDDFVHFLSINT